jgi:hypothetical protein
MVHPLDDVENTPWGKSVTESIDQMERELRSKELLEAEAASKREIDIRFSAMAESIEKLERNMDARFSHTEQMFELAQDSAKRAVDKAELAQGAHNVASNEWRATLNDFKVTLVGRAEFDRFYAEFSAYRLEQSRQMSLSAGAKQERTESKEDWKSLLALIIAIGAAVAAFLTRHV